MTKIGKSNGKVRSCVSILTLNDSNARSKSSVSQSTIYSAIKIVLDGGKVKYGSRSDREKLLKSAVESGISRATSNDDNKLNFIKEILMGKDEKFLSDVYYQYIYTYDKGNYRGKCGKDLCSKEYIKYYEKRIFDKNIEDFYTSINSSDNYKKMLYSPLEEIYNMLKRDLEQPPAKGYISLENADIVKRVLEELKNCKVISKDIISYIEKFKPEDINRKMDNKLSEVKRLANKLNNSYDELATQTQDFNIPIPGVAGNYDCFKLIYFAELVKSGGEYDLKSKPDWKSNWFEYKSMIIRNDVPGNVLYGYFGSALGISKDILLGAAEVAQIWDNLFKYCVDLNKVKKGDFKNAVNFNELRKRVTKYSISKENKSLIKTTHIVNEDFTYNLMWVFTNFDDRHDQDAIKYGINLYR